MDLLLRRVGWRLVPACALAVAAGAVPLFLSCHRAPPPATRPQPARPPVPPWFEDMTEKAGLDFVHDAGPIDGKYFMPQIIGSGAALFDFNNDGLLDIYLLQNGGPNGARCRLYQQTPDHRFKDVSAGSGLDIAGYNMGVAVGDVNNDGLPDVLVTQYGGVKLFLNNGDGTFTDVTDAAGLKNPGWGCSAAFFDYDCDGWLDLVIVNYVAYDPDKPCQRPNEPPDYCGPNTQPGQVARLFHNRGPIPGARGKSVRFEDVTKASGLGTLPGPGLGVVCADFDGDGWPDILVANDGVANRLWVNRHDGTFADEAASRNVAVNRMGATEANMGIALGDLNDSDLFAVFITHMTSETHTLWMQGPRGRFEDVTSRAGLTRTQWRGTGFGVVLGDFDQDGALDLALVNGRVAKGTKAAGDALGPHWGLYAERNQLFTSDGAGRFTDLSVQNDAFCGRPNVARGLAYGDVTGDGALDLLVTTVADRARLYRNVAPNRGHWLLVRAVDPKLGGRDAYGAEVRVRAGDRRWLRLINPGSSFLCSNDVRAHFGLGSAGRVDEIEVRWPDGTAEVFPGCDADRQIVLSRGAGAPHE
jgi:enediyne biosynthesis protein E4